MEISFNYAELRAEAEKSFLSYIKRDDKRRREWESAENDWKERWKESWIKGWIEGYKIGYKNGYKIGLKKAAEEIALKLLQHGYSVEMACKCTSLSMDEVNSLKAKLQ